MRIKSGLPLVLLASLLLFNGCAFVAEALVNGLVWGAIDAATSKKEPSKVEPSRTETVTTLHLTNGDSLTLLDYRVESDTLFGEKEDYTEVKVWKPDIVRSKTKRRVIPD